MTTETVDTSAAADATQNNANAADSTTKTTAVTTTDVADKASTVAENATTALTTDEGDDKAAPSSWPEDWREKYSKGDEKLAKQLARYASPEAAIDALFAAQKRISQGELGPKKPGKDSTPEEIAAYREMMGVPEKVDAYFEGLPGGLVIGEEDKPIFDAVAEKMHGLNMSKAQMQGLVEWYYDFQEQSEQEMYEANRTAEVSSRDALRDEYGPAFKSHIAAAQTLLAGLPDGIGEAIINAVGDDGVKLGNNANVIRALVQLATEINPVASVIPGGTNVKSIDDELASIADIQRKNPKEYFSERVQNRELELLSAKAKLQARG